MKRLLYLFSIIIVASCQKPAQPPRPPVTVTAFKVEPETIPADFEYVGVARSSHPVEIRARVEGYLWGIDYTEGSMVDENQLLFLIDPREYEAKLQEARGELSRQEAILWRAKQSLKRIEPLYEKNAASQRDLDNATAAVLAGEADVISAQANVYEAELNLSYTRVTSPIKGWSGRAAFKEGTLITPNVNGLLTEVSVIDPIWVLFSISDNDLLLGRTEQAKKELILPAQQEYSVTLQLADGSIYPCKGQVNFASPTLDPQTGAMVVRATFSNPQSEIMPGQFVRAVISGAMRPNAIFVPQKSVFQGQNGMYVFVISADNKVSARSVTPGPWYKDFWIIKQGLKPGDVVVADGINKVQEGSQVKITSYVQMPAVKK